MLIQSLKSFGLISLLALSACATTSTAVGAGAGASAAAGYGFVVAPMAVVPPASGPSNGTVATTLQADGRASAGTDQFGRVERNRVVSVRGDDLLRLNADGTVTLPWSAAADGLSFRFTPQGLEAVNQGRTTLITVDATGAYSENGTPTGASIAPYAPANRDTALLLRMLHAISFMHGMAAANATTAPAH